MENDDGGGGDSWHAECFEEFSPDVCPEFYTTPRSKRHSPLA